MAAAAAVAMRVSRECLLPALRRRRGASRGVAYAGISPSPSSATLLCEAAVASDASPVPAVPRAEPLTELEGYKGRLFIVAACEQLPTAGWPTP